jgi:HAD superfamily hydrolase (TIGR01490 family)
MAQPFAAFDIDGTLIRWQLYHAVSDQLAKDGLIAPALHSKSLEARMAWKVRSHEDSFKEYEEQVVVAYEAALLSLKANELNEAVKKVTERYKDQVYTYTRNLIKYLKSEGYLLFAISGSPKQVVELLADYYKFDDFRGTDYLQRDGRFTGEKIAHVGKKHQVVKEMAKEHNATFNNSIAVGDSEGDISMLSVVDRPIAFNPTKKLFEQAKKQSWKIVIERKNMIYELENRDGSYVLAQTNT